MVLLLIKIERKVRIFTVISWYNEKKRRIFIFNDISEHVTLVQVMDSVGRFNHALIITRCCIYGSN